MTRTDADLVSLRLAAQFPLGARDATPQQVVSRLGGVQAQDYAGAKWSIGSRMPDIREHEVDHVIQEGRVIRTWAFRGTLHLLASGDAPRILNAVSPLVFAANQRRYRQLELEEPDFTRSNRLIRSYLQHSNRPRTRSEICVRLQGEGIGTQGQRAYYLLQRAALEQLICFAPTPNRENCFQLFPRAAGSADGGQQTLGLTALAERYFDGHGPASIRDFCWWAGVATREARAAVEDSTLLRPMDGPEVEMWEVDRKTATGPQPPLQTDARLLSPFDEYLLGYKDRRAVLDPANAKLVNRGGGMMKAALLLGGRVAGVWAHSETAAGIRINLQPFRPFSRGERDSIEEAAERYARYRGTDVEIGS